MWMDRDAGYVNAVFRNAVINQLVLHKGGGDQEFIHFLIYPRAMCVIIGNDGAKLDMKAQTLEPADYSIWNRMGTNDEIRLKLCDNLRGMCVKYAMERKLSESI